jgi:DNA-3-methyladenine glycosylase
MKSPSRLDCAATNRRKKINAALAIRVVDMPGSQPSTLNVQLSPAPLPFSFYEPSAEIVAPKLLGHYLLRRTPDGAWAGGAIVESEAYLANDLACHGFRRETARNRSMYGPPGRAYVYFIYGNYFCFNAVCAHKGVAEAVLVRAIEPAFGEPWMQRNRPVAKVRELTSGPSKLCLALNIDRKFDGADLSSLQSELIIAKNPNLKRFLHERGPVITTTRIGLSVAEHMPLRFYLDGSKFVSKRPR